MRISDWSSDVCSSDLLRVLSAASAASEGPRESKSTATAAAAAAAKAGPRRGLDPPSGLAGSIQRMHRPRQPFDFVGRMADVDDRQRSFVAYALEVGAQFVAAGLVEDRQRLAEQQEARLRQQGPAEPHAPVSPAGPGRGGPPSPRAAAQQGATPAATPP